MKFGPVPVAEAEGAVLAHSLALPDGRLRKGLVLEAAHLARLRDAGVAEVTVARLEPGDVDEDSAAKRLARAVAGDGLRVGKAATGRANLFADAPGIVEIDAASVHALNAVDPMITLATVPEYQRMGAGGMVATVKIISYAVTEAALAAACAAAPHALRLRSPVYGTAALVQTQVGDEDGSKGHDALQTRLTRLGMALGSNVVVRHETGALAEALRAQEADMLFVLTGSATSDIRDVGPEALRAAGGEVTYFGMPVDPGNLLFLGTLGDKPVIGLPGCARSPALNGADWVLERVICGVSVSGADIAAMGVGGLLKDIPARGRPREA